jgi:DNA-binding LacI/PurR family transcriptional regulator
MTKSGNRPKGKPVTMQDVAQLAGVSQSTVSRVLSKSPSAVPISQDTYDRVLTAVEQLGYHPNLTASSLRQQKTFMVAVMVADLSNAFYHSITRAIQDVAHQHGYDVLIANSDHIYENEQQFCRAMMRRPVDGIIMVPYHLNDDDLDQVIQRTGASVVVLGSHITHPLVDSVWCDDAAATYQAARWLIEQKGYTDIAYIGVSLSFPPGLRRLEAYQAALRDAGIPCSPEWVQQGDFTLESGQQAMERLLSLPRPPRAVMACNDLMALGAMNAALDWNYRIPDDIAVMGFDDIPMASLMRPSLTTITQFSIDIGKQLAEMLFERIEGTETGPARRHEIPLRLVARQST